MLKLLRDKSQSIFFKIFLVLIIIGFAAWGVGDLTGNNKNNIIFKTKKYEVFLQDIIKDFDRLRNSYSTPVETDEAIKNGMLNQVLSKYKVKILVDQETHENGFLVPREKIKESISKDKTFQDNDKKFSKKIFKRILSRNNISEDQYIDMLNAQISKSNLLYPININKSYNNEFVNDFINWENKLIDLKYIFVPYIEKKHLQKPTEKELKKFFENNRDKYFSPIRRDIRFIEFSPMDYFANIKVDEEEIKTLYKDRKDQFIKQENRDYFQIIFKNKPEAISFYNQIKLKNDYLNEAKKLKYEFDDILIKSVLKDDLQKELIEPIFNAKINEIMGPIKTSFGFHVIQIKSINKQKITPFNDVKNKLEKEIKFELAIEKLYSQIDLINDKVFSGDTLDEIASSNDLEINRNVQNIKNFTITGSVFNNNKYIKTTFNKKFVNLVWKSEINEIIELADIGDEKFVLLKVTKEHPKKSQNFNQVKNNLKNDFLLNLSKKLTLNQAQKTYKNTNLEEGKTISGIHRFNNINLTDKKLFTNDTITKIFNNFNNQEKINYLKTQKGVLIFKKTKSYLKDDLNKNNYTVVQNNFSNSFNEDLKQKYFEFLEKKHNLKTNFKSLENFVKIK